jgi:hypothetical protein
MIASQLEIDVVPRSMRMSKILAISGTPCDLLHTLHGLLVILLLMSSYTRLIVCSVFILRVVLLCFVVVREEDVELAWNNLRNEIQQIFKPI